MYAVRYTQSVGPQQRNTVVSNTGGLGKGVTGFAATVQAFDLTFIDTMHKQLKTIVINQQLGSHKLS